MLKDNVSKFNHDVDTSGQYQYTTEARLSSKLANKRTTDAIIGIYDFANKRVLDIGCGDGTYSFDYLNAGASYVLGVEPASKAILYANQQAQMRGLTNKIQFKVASVYDLDLENDNHFDVVVFRGVIHHLADGEKALNYAAKLAHSIIICEPNGSNPVLKLIEKFSKYHIEHEEQSFSLKTMLRWINSETQSQYIYIYRFSPFFLPQLVC